MRKSIYWPYIMAAYVSLLSLGLVDNTRGPFLPDLTHDLGFTDTQASLIFVVPSFFSFLGSQFSSVLIYRFHPSRGIRYGMFIMGCGFLALGKMTGIWGLVLFGGLFGWGFGMVNVFEHMAIQMGATEKTRRKLLSGLHSMYALASLIAPLLVKYLYALQWTWREGFASVAMLPIVMSGLFFFLEGNGPKKVLEKPREKTTKGHVVQYIYVGLAIACYIGSELAISSRMTLYVRRYTDATPEFSTYYLAAFFLLLFIGRILFMIFDLARWRSEIILRWSFILSFFSFLCGLLFSPWFMSLCGALMAPCFAMCMDYVFSVFKDRASEAMTYVMGVGSLLVVLMHYTIGVVSDMLGLKVALIICPILLMISLLMLSLRSRIFGEFVMASNPSGRGYV